jgi:four helix bundle protein
MGTDGAPEDLRARTKKFALRVIPLYRSLSPKDRVAQEYGFQALRSSASVGAHYREASRARSDAEFASKMNGGLQELDETTYWFELLSESGIVSATKLQPLLREANELIAIFVSCIRNSKRD